MKKIVLSIIYILSFLLIPILILSLNIYKKDSPHYYINTFKDNKSYFEKAVDLKISHFNDNIKYKEYDEYKKLLFALCRVDLIDILIDDKNNISVEFCISDVNYYPSTESKYRMILYQSNDELPEHFKKYYNKKITSNWFFILKDNQYYWNVGTIIFIILFDLFIWIFGIIRLIRYVF